ncbi:hypothetical protein [Clostridium algidicarnis]|uniref:hypothetical protein n=1 Tax=Clostridium algidicarnis TaxID=37659 RepID=UPI0016287A73|nr:hypothetical protein [Clostridium algidicarnis]MBB6696626.1 hypothetical protein [Clostridium algidicarnis]MBU3203880.1 hypothetical protein [Clostridium algidicarnis]MBU3212034.1 hypothetical protein [Clostridium algidicarnis]MBU3221460.1 hypothetical protein [Clostridium algidicarnis]
MKVKFEVADFSYIMNSIKEFLLYEPETFLDMITYFYKDIDESVFISLDKTDQVEYIEKRLLDNYNSNELVLLEKKNSYQKCWDFYEEEIQQGFEEVFDIDLKDKFNNMVAYISLNPVMPRYLETNTFDIFYINSDKEAVGCALHEITHFIWFNIWQSYFHDNPEEYETPHLKWILSEMAIDPILNEKRLAYLNPYEQKAYDCFYSIEIDGKPAMDCLREIYENNSILDFMKKGYEFCLVHRDKIGEVKL